MGSSRVNYLYFGAFFILLVILSSSSIFTKGSIGGAQLFFFLYALGQIVIEVVFLIYLVEALRKYVGKMAAAFFIGLTFFATFLHIFDFLMDRILDLSIWETLNVFVFQENLANFMYLLDASGISLGVWLIFFAILIALPFVGIALYHFTDKLASKRALMITRGHFLQALLVLPIGLFLWDMTASKAIHPDAYTAFRKSLPWKCTFLEPKNTLAAVPGPMRKVASEEFIAKAIEVDDTLLKHKPNIYIFVVESLREDVITEEIAPHLTQFKNDFAHFDHAIANGNGTHISWFSIFHSQLPYHWKHFQGTRKTGSPALQLLKKWGYNIHLYTSAQLCYYGMEELIFGHKSYLLDSRNTFHHAPPKSAADSDAESLSKLQSDIEKNIELREGQVFVIFWDCTHFDYSWPKNWTPKFTPFAQEFSYFRAIQSKKTIRAIKNRYRNAVHYMDHLFGKFMKNVEEDAIVVFTGDHGEEFFDHGHLFHNSHLTKEQTSIPLYFKLGDGKRKPMAKNVVSQMDIFPSIIDLLAAKSFSFFEGNSFFQESKFPYAVTARFNAGCTPYEFSIHNGKYKMIAQFDNRAEISDSKKLKIISVRTDDDKGLPNDWIPKELSDALHQLFDSSP